MDNKIRVKDIVLVILIIFVSGVVYFNIRTISTSKKDMEDILKNVGAFLAVLVSITVLSTWMWKNYFLPKRKKNDAQKLLIENLSSGLENLKPVVDKIGKIEKQLIFNGGSSVMDVVVRIEEVINSLKEEITDIKLSQRSFFEAMEVAYWVSDNDGQCVYASNALCKLVGRTEDELKGNNWATWLHPNSKKIFEIWNDSVENNMVFDENYTFRKNDGYWQDVNGFATHKVSNGAYIGSIGRLIKMGDPYR